jgi:hypothetical protein
MRSLRVFTFISGFDERYAATALRLPESTNVHRSVASVYGTGLTSAGLGGGAGGAGGAAGDAGDGCPACSIVV